MEKNDAVEKIQKLLRLAESPNKKEAQNALLHARSLMAKYCLSDADISNKTAEKNVRYEHIGVTYTARATAWKQTLAGIIAGAYRCLAFASHSYRGQTYKLGLAGLEEDFEICKQAILYAIDCVESNIDRKIRKSFLYAGYPKRELTELEKNYAQGFIIGLNAAFEQQTKENQEWGLVLVTPQEVQDHIDAMTRGTLPPRKVATDTVMAAKIKQNGYKDGWNHGTIKRMNEGKEQSVLCEG